jgi:hypothetical protein
MGSERADVLGRIYPLTIGEGVVGTFHEKKRVELCTQGSGGPGFLGCDAPEMVNNYPRPNYLWRCIDKVVSF